MSYAKMLKEREKNKHLYRQDFSESKENYSLTQYGEKFNLYQHIQNAREDTEIIPTLEKYGMAKGIEVLKRYDPEKASKYYGDFREITDMRNMMDKSKKAEEMWKALPLEIRQKFGNSKREFFEKGDTWLKNEIETQLQKQTANITQATATTTNTGATENDGQK